MTNEDQWLSTIRENMYARWIKATGHRPGANNGTWACEIAFGCQTCNEHLSLPCSLLAEANEIGLFLSTTCFDGQPTSFLRFYLILLSEFVSQLNDVAKLLGLDIGKPPKEVVVWANRWAKHRLHILVQHHPTMVFADEHGDQWSAIEANLPGLVCEDRCGKQRPAMIINTEWLCSVACDKQPSLGLANGEAKAVVIVPPMQTFLDDTCGYFRRFIDAALTVPEKVREFQSGHASVRC